MCLVSALMPLYVLGMVGVGRVTLTHTRTPVPDLAYVLTAMASAPVALSAVVVMDISLVSTLSMTLASDLLTVQTSVSFIGCPNYSAAALPLLRVKPQSFGFLQ